jgi:hypothetical protein
MAAERLEGGPCSIAEQETCSADQDRVLPSSTTAFRTSSLGPTGATFQNLQTLHMAANPGDQ